MRGWTVGNNNVFVYTERFPRACGDGPSVRGGMSGVPGFSPRMRGWTGSRERRRANPKSFPRACGDGPQLRHWADATEVVFPAHAGMDRGRQDSRGARRGFSPRMRGWTASDIGTWSVKPCFPRACGDGPNHAVHERGITAVFPAHAGMDRPRRTRAGWIFRFPRACGDGPTGRS